MSDTNDTNGTNEGRLNRVRVVQETSRVYPHVLEAYHGENVRIEVDFRNYGVPVDLTGGTAGLYYRGPSDPEGYYHFASLQVDPDEPSVVVVDWGPSLDGGDPEVEWYVSVSVGTPPATSFHGAGTLKLEASPGFDPAVLPPATMTLDFDEITVLHAPYWTKTEADEKYMPASYVAPVQSVNGETGAVVLDAADVGAATTQYVDTGLAGKLDTSGGTMTGALSVYDTVTFANGGMLAGTFSLSSSNIADKSEIPAVPVKSVKVNGTALTPDAQGAVDVPVPTVPADVATETYVNRQITAAIGSINSVLDIINGQSL